MSVSKRRWKLARNSPSRQALTAMNEKQYKSLARFYSTPEKQKFSKESPRLHYADGGRYVRLSFKRRERSLGEEWNETVFGKHRVRGACKGFSFSSRRRFLDRTCQISCEAELPCFVTMTLPDDCYRCTIAEFGEYAKLLLDVELKRLGRACSSACGFWRLEWQARKSGLHVGKLFPHFHLLVWGLGERLVSVDSETGEEIFQSFLPVIDPQQQFVVLSDEVLRSHRFDSESSIRQFASRSVGAQWGFERVHSKPEYNFMSAQDWFSLSWYHVVGSGNLDHFMAGCRVEKTRKWRGVMCYCAKYMTKADADEWMPDARYGRSWGIFNRAAMPWAKIIDIPLDDDVGVRLRRVARRYLEHQTGRRVQRHWGITIYCDARRFSRLIPAPPPDCPF